ncbi:MAG: hypothetical protein H6R26_1938, partial [Proteobacteria bacterium]|nr:hypothetical protein [Pseudomonadota bacterium]
RIVQQRRDGLVLVAPIIQHKKGIFGEFKLGVIDSPDFKITIGYSFR